MTQWDTLCVYRLRVGCSQNWWFSVSYVEDTVSVGRRQAQGERCAEYSKHFDPKSLSSQRSDSPNGDVTWDRNKDAKQCFKRYYYTQNKLNSTARWKMVVLEICKGELLMLSRVACRKLLDWLKKKKLVLFRPWNLIVSQPVSNSCAMVIPITCAHKPQSYLVKIHKIRFILLYTCIYDRFQPSEPHWDHPSGARIYHFLKRIFTIYNLYFSYSCYMTFPPFLQYQVKNKNYPAPCQCHLPYFAIYGVLITMFLHIQVLWHFRPYRLINSYHRFDGSLYLIQGQKSKYSSPVGAANLLDITFQKVWVACHLPPTLLLTAVTF
jgi:hypothetical protein